MSICPSIQPSIHSCTQSYYYATLCKSWKGEERGVWMQTCKQATVRVRLICLCGGRLIIVDFIYNRPTGCWTLARYLSCIAKTTNKQTNIHHLSPRKRSGCLERASMQSQDWGTALEEGISSGWGGGRISHCFYFVDISSNWLQAYMCQDQ